jgi:hypothetical protein
MREGIHGEATLATRLYGTIALPLPSVLFAGATKGAHAQTQPELRFLNGALTSWSKYGRFDANRVILLCFAEQPKDSEWRFLRNVRDKAAA